MSYNSPDILIDTDATYNDSEDMVACTLPLLLVTAGYYVNWATRRIYYFLILISCGQGLERESEYGIPISRISNLEFKSLWDVMGDVERSGNLDENSKSVKDWLDENLNLISYSELHGVWIYKYES